MDAILTGAAERRRAHGVNDTLTARDRRRQREAEASA
jgi:hypothetical protein